MLQKGFTRVGIGCVKVGGTVYWAQEFGSGKAGGKSSDKYTNKTVDATWKTLKSAKTKISASTNEITVGVGEQIALPKVVLTSRSGAKRMNSSASNLVYAVRERATPHAAQLKTVVFLTASMNVKRRMQLKKA